MDKNSSLQHCLILTTHGLKIYSKNKNELALGPRQTRPAVVNNYLVFDHKKPSVKQAVDKQT